MKHAFLLGAAAILLTSTFVRADAPADQYAPFDSSDTTIVDNYTKLTWNRAVGGPGTFFSAQAMCGGGTRLPTVKELLTLVDESPHDYELVDGSNPNRYIDGSAFRQTPVDEPFWTETIIAKSGGVTSSVLAVSFGNGGAVPLNVSANAYFRCVK